MRCKCKLFNVVGIPASDGSIIPRDVVEQYINSEKYRNDIESRNMLGALTHRVRNLSNAPTSAGTALSKTIGKDDLLLLPDVSAPTHYIEKVYIENDGWCYADIKILDEEGFDDNAIQNIRRLKGLLKQGVKPGVSAVIVGYWRGDSGSDYLERLVSLKSCDITMNSSFKNAQITEIYDDNGEKMFSDTTSTEDFVMNVNPKDYKFDGLKVKQFSDFECGDLPRSSKIEGMYTTLKAKQFSANGMVEELSENVIEPPITEEVEKSFSVSSLKERLRENTNYSPRQRFRLLVMNYRQLVRQMGGVEKIEADTLKTLKSLFTTDLLDIMKAITPAIMEGKNPGTMLGASSLGKGVRVAVQNMYMPLRQSLQEISKTNSISKARYQKVQEAYIGFVNSMIDEVFRPMSSMPSKEEEEVKPEDE